MAKAHNKTQVTAVSPKDFLTGVEPERRRAEGLELLEFFERVTGLQPKMWGPSMVGFGRYHYRYESGREGDAMITGFSPRKSALTLYIMPGYRDLSEKLARLGKHKIGRSCLYINRLSDVDMAVLEEIVTDPDEAELNRQAILAAVLRGRFVTAEGLGRGTGNLQTGSGNHRRDAGATIPLFCHYVNLP